MKTLLLIFFLLCTVNVYALDESKQIINVQNLYFMTYYDGQYSEVFRPPTNSIYGYGWIGSDLVLISYQSPDFGEALAVIDIINVKTKKIVTTDKIFEAGETNISVNANNHHAVYNDSDGLHLLFMEKGKLVKEKISSVEGVYQFAPFWIDVNTIGYYYFKGSKPVFARKSVKLK